MFSNKNLPRQDFGTFFLDLLCEPVVLSGVHCEDGQETEELSQKNYQPKLLHDEIEAARAVNVGLYIAQKTTKSKKSLNVDANIKKGLLIITNFRLSFVTFNDKDTKESIYQQNNYLGKYDITLSNIDEIHQITRDQKKKSVGPQYKNSDKIEALRIVCKNFRNLTFDFKWSEVKSGKHIADALVKFAFPDRHNLLFLYSYKENYYPTVRCPIRLFKSADDWNQELERCGLSSTDSGWRVMSPDLRENNSLPMHFVIPRQMSNTDYANFSKFFCGDRSVVWVWSIGYAAIVRMSYLTTPNINTSYENSMLERVRACDPERKEPKLMDLTKLLPSPSDVNTGYYKLRQICAPESDRNFMDQDKNFYTLLEKTNWLLYVSLCLKYSNEAARHMKLDRKTIVIQENNGRDMSCVISSLIQVLLDPFYRTITGIQTLIQKEWVSLGHPFSDRLGHVFSVNSEKSPMFLLFLDCVWQLLQQFPMDFEYSETFLTTIWDSAFVPIFDTFQFNCEYDRHNAIQNEKLLLRPVWDWAEQFSERDIALFTNPLYKKPVLSEQEIELNKKSKLPPTAYKLPGMEDIKKKTPGQRVSVRASLDTARLLKIKNSSNNGAQPEVPQNRYLECKFEIKDMEIWSQCYYRWIPYVEIKNGGSAQIDLINRMIVSNIHKLQKALESRNFSDLPQELLGQARNHSSDEEQDELDNNKGNRLPVIDSFFPFSSNIENTEELFDLLMSSQELLAGDSSLDDLDSLVE